MAPRKPALALLPRALRKHWPAMRLPYLVSLLFLSALAVKLALFTDPAFTPVLPESAHSGASASLAAPNTPPPPRFAHLLPVPPAADDAANDTADDAPADPAPKPDAAPAADTDAAVHSDASSDASSNDGDDDDDEEDEVVEAQIFPMSDDEKAYDRAVDDKSAAAAEAHDSSADCMRFIVYDKPVKTGSTAVRDALLAYFSTRGAEFVPCTFQACNAVAERILAGEEPKRNLVEHLLGQNGLVERLGEFGYYKATSIRDPKSRWESAFRYNRAKKAKHYGIEPDVSYEEFMSRMPPCSLYDFYDRKGAACGDDVEERIKNIVYRYHEIIDLYDEPAGQLHMRLVPYLAVSNKSPETNANGNFDSSRLDNETRLYNALKKRRLELHGHEPLLC